ncbi:tetratricopeptide repeat protein [Lutimonas vermicola]|uniref:Tetratricopeptide repeat protein n=1 Tax=Lutimonas vermicola TaxID=414288 RepID=A0ABU9KY00_9FLAO
MKVFSLTTLLFCLFLISCENSNDKNEYKEIESLTSLQTEGYVGDESCTTCHQEAFKDWKGSHHDKAMQLVDDTTVLGDFNDVKVSLDGVSYFFYKKESGFFVKTIELDGSENEYKITYVFGLTPLQQYIVDFKDGKKQVLRVTWDTLEKKWFHQYAGDEIIITDWLHWSRGAQNWNTMCAECHSTNLKKNYFVEKDSFHTTYSSINVSCESCHGPGEKHINWANSGQTDKNMQVILGNDQQAQMNMCAPCHARRVKLTKDLIPGLNFEDQYMVQNISSQFYHLDGQILEEDYVYGSFLQSKMHAQGIKCGDCHNVHSNKLKMTGNQLCLQCHVPDTYDAPQHHFHEANTEASRCINCHMTGRYYMGNDFRRDHSFRIPRPDQSVEYGTPNACSECHNDKSEEWAAEWVVNWYGKERRPHFSDYLLISNQPELNPRERQKLDTFINDLNYPAIARSTVINNLSYTNEEQLKSLLTALNDSSAVVRYNALMQFRTMSPQDRIAVAQKHMVDSIRLVRIGSAQLVIGFEGDDWTESEKLSLFKAREELEEMLYSNADFSTGRLQLGDYFMQANDYRSAIKHYEMALKMDSLLYPVYTNLATAYSINQQMDKALETLNTWMDKQPDAGRPYYLRALLHFELGNNEIGEQDLKMAIDLDPQDSRSMYNLATYYYQIKEYQRAEIQVKKALGIEPGNQEIKYLYALILKELGKIQEANQLMKEIQAS